MKIKTLLLVCFLIFAGNTVFSASTYYIPHMAVGSIGNGGFRTTFVFFNNQSSSANVELKLTGDDGSPLSVTISGMGTDSSFSFSLAKGAAKILQADSSGNLKVGAATVTSSLAIGVSGIYSEYGGKGEFITEVGVENSRLLNQFVIPVQLSGSIINTGLALFNPGASNAEITARLSNTNGTSAGNVAFTIPAGQHKAAYLNNSNMFPSLTSFSGTLSIQSSVPISAVTLRQNTAAAIDYYTSCPVVSASSTKSIFYIPHVADGTVGGTKYKTTLMLFNFSTREANVTLKFTNNNGAAFPVTFTGVAATTNSDIYTFALVGGQSTFLQTDGSTVPGATAAVEILSQDTAGNAARPGGPGVPIGVAAFYTQYGSEWNFQTEVGVLDSPALSSFTIPIDSQVPEGSSTPAFDTAFALFNPGESTISVKPKFFNADGVATNSTTTIELTANGHYAAYFNQLFPNMGTVQGSLVIAPGNAVLSALTLRNNWAPVGWTSLPVTSGAYQTAGGPVFLDGVVSTNAQNTTSSISVYHTTGTGPDPVTLASISWNKGGADSSISSVTFTPEGGGNAVNLTMTITQVAGQAGYAAIYSLKNPPVEQSGMVTVTFTGEVPNGANVGIANFANVNQTTPFGAAGGAGGLSGTYSTVTMDQLSGNELVMDTVFLNASTASSQTITPGLNQTLLWKNWAGQTRGGASIKQVTAATTPMSWAATESAHWGIAAVPMIPAHAALPEVVDLLDFHSNSLGPYTVPEGNNRIVLFIAHAENGANDRKIESVTLGDKNLTLLVRDTVSSVGETQYFAMTEIWYLKEADIPKDANSFQVTWDTSAVSSFEVSYSYATLVNVDQDNPIVDTESAKGTTGTITTPAFDVVENGRAIAAATCGNAGSSWTPDSDYTELEDFSSASSSANSQKTKNAYSADGTDTVSATFGNVNRQVLVVASFRFVAP
jgi:hypothetical protein